MNAVAVPAVYHNPRFECEQRRWLDNALRRTRYMSGALGRWHEGQLQRGKTLYDVNQETLGYINRLSRADFNLTAYDSELCELAESMPSKFIKLRDAAMGERQSAGGWSDGGTKRVIESRGWGDTLSALVDKSPTEAAAERLESRYSLGLDYAAMVKKYGEDGAGHRLADHLWWRKLLRKTAHRGTEGVLRELGAVCKKRAPYVSNVTLRRYLEQQRRNRLLLENLEAENEDGESFTLAQLSDLGVSNPHNRFAELMVRNRGFEEWVEKENKYQPQVGPSSGFVCMFYTWTTPSKYHAVNYDGAINPKYSGASPVDAMKYLNKQWQKARAAIKREGLEIFGFRVAEPHHDGTPHWHIMLFVRCYQAAQLTDILRAYVMAEDGDEAGADKYRFDVVAIDPAKGGPAGYIVKYISKNIKGIGVGIDEEADDYAVVTSARVQAWASVWGIRQFQQIGGPPVTPYRELRRAARNKENLPVEVQECEQLQLLMDAADKSDWCEYTDQMGGAVCARVLRPLQAAQFVRDTLGKYGDAVMVLAGLWSHFVGPMIRSRFHSWTVRARERLPDVGCRAPPLAPA
ncbi:replication endonuclease [Zhongshania sp. BJYM1]|uniref:replication endonuclease n=1 Tax=Zhongshania aquatica TaxID=2965069 RepID=UPI0022B3AAC5|nr:replication endonuclease [Marortus sp. BJYM1]